MLNAKKIKELLDESSSRYLEKQRNETYAKFTKEELRRADESEKDSDLDSFIDSEEYYLVKDMLVNHYFSTMDRVAEPQVEDSNVVSFPKKKATVLKEESTEPVPLFEVLPAAAQSKDSHYKWYQLEGRVKDNLGNEFKLLMEPNGADEKEVSFEFKLIKESDNNTSKSNLELYSGIWTDMQLVFGTKLVIMAKFYVFKNMKKIIGEGVVVEPELPNIQNEHIRFIPSNKKND